MKVSNMEGRSGPVANQFLIKDDYGNMFFQSYKSIIIKRARDGAITLDATYWDYSRTTGKYRNAFLGESKAETERKIKEGKYTLADLNTKE